MSLEPEPPRIRIFRATFNIFIEQRDNLPTEIQYI